MDGLKARLSFDAVAYDYDDEYLTIDTDTHTININNVSRLFGVQYDGNSKLIKFRIRNKLSDIQKMQDSIVYINWIDSRGVKGQSIAINKTINDDTCEFAWKVPFDALKNSGVLHFAMSAVVTKNSSSVIDQRWSTKIASVITPDGIYIKSYTPSSEEEDRIAQIYNELSKMINTQSENLQSQVNSLNDGLVDLYNNLQIIRTTYTNQDLNIDGSVVDSDTYRLSDYIKCDKLVRIKTNFTANQYVWIGFYDDNKKFIKRYQYQTTDDIYLYKFVTGYIRVEVHKAQLHNIDIEKETIFALAENLDETNNYVKELKVDYSIKAYEVLVGEYGVGSIIGNLGDIISYGKQDYWRHGIFNVRPYTHYNITFSENGNETITNYIVGLDSDDKIIYKYYNTPSAEIKTVSYDIATDAKVSKLAIMSSHINNMSNEQLITVKEFTSDNFIKDSTNNNMVINSRIGYMVYEVGTPPENTCESFLQAYYHGYKCLLCDLHITSDGKYVLMHDDTINNVARNVDGSQISENIYVSRNTLEKLNEYDYGIKKGIGYKGMKIPLFEDVLKMCKYLPCTLIIEFKGVLTNTQKTNLKSLIRKYHMENKVLMSDYYLPSVYEYDTLVQDIVDLSESNKNFIISSSDVDHSLTMAKEFLKNGYKPIIQFDSNTVLTENQLNECSNLGIRLSMTEIKNKADLDRVIKNGMIYYCDYVASRIDIYPELINFTRIVN
ncbi:glycerophosphodiester phosphodiesterase family protein [Holdemanella porci]|jgi:glycerophosphoryl diester phosphodiesterase|uniref:glycerophosphodiester phosphodiesterase family protein n=1 Tax=Holdemanella porci TaxID=2652276 RepID=UPI003FD8A303